MSKIIKENWKYKIEFTKDSFWPYEQKFGRKDCYYDDIINDRWSTKFPFKNKQFDNTEIFLETDDIIICTGERTNLSWTEKNFIDIINLKTEKKQRLYIEEVNLIYNAEKEIVVNANIKWIWKTIKLDQETIEIKEEKEEKLLAFFKVIYNENEDKWYRLDWNWNWYYLSELEIENKLEYFNQVVNLDNNFNESNIFYRDKLLWKFVFSILLNWKIIRYLRELDLWKLSGSNFKIDNLTFINSQNYFIWKKLRRKIIFNKYKPLITIIGWIYFIYIFGLIFTDLLSNWWFSNNIIDKLFFLFFVLIFFFAVFVARIIYFFIDLKKALVYRKKVNEKFDLKDFEIVRKKQDISRIKQKIMVK